jgi:hypothetical protein
MHQLPFTALLNHLFAGPVTALLLALGIHPKHRRADSRSPCHADPGLPGADRIFCGGAGELSVENPGTLQHMMETFTA